MTDSRSQENQGVGRAARYGVWRRGLPALLLLSCLFHPLAALAAYSYSADGSEVTDSTTGLIWRRCAEGMAWSGSTCTGTAATYTHEGALRRAASEATASKAWRVPNVMELSSITKLGEAVNPSIDITAFPGTPSSWFWTSSPYVGGSNVAWYVYFSSGYVSNYFRNFNFHVRLVR